MCKNVENVLDSELFMVFSGCASGAAAMLAAWPGRGERRLGASGLRGA